MSESLYLYGFVPGAASLPEGGLLGVADFAVELIQLPEVSAAVSRVPAAVYNAEAIEARSEDLQWLAAQGIAHERAVAWFVDHAEILPVPLFTLYSSAAALEREAAERAPEIADTLERFSGLREWDLKISYDADRLEPHLGRLSEEVAALDERIEAAGPGKKHLLGKKRADLVRTEVGRAARRLAGELLDDVGGDAVRTETLDLPEEAGELPVVLHAALLVASDAADALRETVASRARELDEIGLRVGFTGPWAPYRFIGMEYDGGETGSAGIGSAARRPRAAGAG